MEAAKDFNRGVAIHCPQTKAENLWAAKWLGQRIPHFNPENVTCLVVTLDGQVVSVVGYSKQIFNRIEVSWASDTPRWLTRSSILYCLAPPFLQWGYHGICMTTAKSNKRMRKFAEGIGFKYEGTLREASPSKENMICYGMLKREYADLIKRYHGEAEYNKFIEYTK